eukprot:gb/GECG01016169.1/.p1 GENE.gb/GECG01016169.1/~~gb/GECG01016169.1/.p1  ORF type:complete len:1658 (+),score=219.89 gb/GECG01016169.1/:1-4974(+)
MESPKYVGDPSWHPVSDGTFRSGKGHTEVFPGSIADDGDGEPYESDEDVISEGDEVVDAHNCRLKKLTRLPLGLRTQIVFVHSNPLQDLGALSLCRNLRKLDLAFCQLTDLNGPRSPGSSNQEAPRAQWTWGALSQLEVLYLHGNKFSSVSALLGIEELGSLQILTVYKNPFREALRTPVRTRRHWYAADYEELDDVAAVSASHPKLRKSILAKTPASLLSLDGELVSPSTRNDEQAQASFTLESSSSKPKLPAPQFHAGASASQHLHALAAELSIVRQKYAEIYETYPVSSSHQRSRSSRSRQRSRRERSQVSGQQERELSKEEVGRSMTKIQRIFKLGRWRRGVLQDIQEYVRTSINDVSSFSLDERRRERARRKIWRCVKSYLTYIKQKRASSKIQKVWRGYSARIQTIDLYLREREAAPAYDTYKYQSISLMRQMAKLCAVTYGADTNEGEADGSMTKQPSTLTRSIFFRKKHKEIVERAVKMAVAVRRQWMGVIDPAGDEWDDGKDKPSEEGSEGFDEGSSYASSEEDEEQKAAVIKYNATVAAETDVSPVLESTYALSFAQENLHKDEPQFQTSHAHILGSWPGRAPSPIYSRSGLSIASINAEKYTHPHRPFFQNTRWFSQSQLAEFAPSLGKGKRVQIQYSSGITPQNSSSTFNSKFESSESSVNPGINMYPRPQSCYVSLVGEWDNIHANPIICFRCNKKVKEGKRRRRRSSQVRRYSVTYFMTEVDEFVDSLALSMHERVPSFIRFHRVSKSVAETLRTLSPRVPNISPSERLRIQDKLTKEHAKSTEETYGETLLALTAPSSRFLARVLVKLPYVISKMGVDTSDEPIVLPADAVEISAAATKVQAFWKNVYYKHSLKPPFSHQLRERRVAKCTQRYYRARMMKRRLQMLAAVGRHTREISSPVLFVEQPTLLSLAGAAAGIRGYGDSIWKRWLLQRLDDDVVDQYPGVWTLRHVPVETLTAQEQLVLIGSIIERGKRTWAQYPTPEHRLSWHFERSDELDEEYENRAKGLETNIRLCLVSPQMKPPQWRDRRVGLSNWVLPEKTDYWRDEEDVLQSCESVEASSFGNAFDGEVDESRGQGRCLNSDIKDVAYGSMFEETVDPLVALVPILSVGTLTQALNLIVYKPKFSDKVYDSVYDHIHRTEIEEAWKNFPNWASLGFKLYAIKFPSIPEARKRAAILLMQTWDSRIGSGATLLTHEMLEEAWERRTGGNTHPGRLSHLSTCCLPTPWAEENIRSSFRLYDSLPVLLEYLMKKMYRRFGRWKLHKRQSRGEILRNVQVLTMAPERTSHKPDDERKHSGFVAEDAEENLLRSYSRKHSSRKEQKDSSAHLPVAQIDLEPLPVKEIRRQQNPGYSHKLLSSTVPLEYSSAPSKEPETNPTLPPKEQRQPASHSLSTTKIERQEKPTKKKQLLQSTSEKTLPDHRRGKKSTGQSSSAKILPDRTCTYSDRKDKEAENDSELHRTLKARHRISSVHAWGQRTAETASSGPFSRGTGTSLSSGNARTVSKAMQQRVEKEKDKMLQKTRRESQEALEQSHIDELRESSKRHAERKRLRKREEATMGRFLVGCNTITRHQSHALTREAQAESKAERIAEGQKHKEAAPLSPGTSYHRLDSSRKSLPRSESGRLGSVSTVGRRSRGPPLRK